MLQLSAYRYIFPPRPETALPPQTLPSYERKREYLAQPKLNGDCMEIYTNGIEYIIMDRHKETYTKTIIDFTTLYRETIAPGLETNKWMVLAGEYMVKSQKNAQGKVWNHKFVIHDILAYDGVQLIGKSTEERVALLDSLYGKDDKEITADGIKTLDYVYTTGTVDCYRVKSYYDCFDKLYSDIVKIGMYEGLVLKKIRAKLQPGTSTTNNSASMVKFRKPTKNYTH